MNCVGCGAEVTWKHARQPHCLTDECNLAYAKHVAWNNVKRVGDCEVWQGTIKDGSAYFAVVVGRDGKNGKRRDFRALALRYPYPEDAKSRNFINKCGTPGCVSLEHNELEARKPVLHISAPLPAEPLLAVLDKRKEPLKKDFHAHISDGRKKGWFTVSTVDAICIDGLGCHPSAIYGWDFFTA